jgi:hypothetical protein
LKQAEQHLGVAKSISLEFVSADFIPPISYRQFHTADFIPLILSYR